MGRKLDAALRRLRVVIRHGLATAAIVSMSRATMLSKVLDEAQATPHMSASDARLGCAVTTELMLRCDKDRVEQA